MGEGREVSLRIPSGDRVMKRCGDPPGRGWVGSFEVAAVAGVR